MPIAGALIGAAGAIGGAAIGASASKKAAKAQLDSTKLGIASQEKMLERQIELAEPFRQGSMLAQNRFLTLLGLAPAQANSAAPSAPTTINVPGFGPITLPGGPAAQPANAMTGSGLNVDRNSPDFGKYARDFGMQDFVQDPGYAFRMSEGQKALERSAAARGGLLSGSALKGAIRFGQDMGSQEYQNAFSRYQTNRSNQLNPLLSLMGQGQLATGTLTSAMSNAGNSIADLYTQGGNARAAGAIGRSNALVGGITGAANSLGDYFSQQSILNQALNGSNYSGRSAVGRAFDNAFANGI